MYGICNLSIVPIRLEPSNTSEMTNQMLFGEDFEILEKHDKWIKIRLSYDNFEGFIPDNQYEEISENLFHKLAEDKQYLSGELIDFISDENGFLTTIPLGSRLPFFENNSFCINNNSFSFEGKINTEKLPKSVIIETAFSFLNVPFLHGGKSPFGIDAFGFTQIVYKLCGYHLYREAKQQATQGDILSFIEESEAGDLAFFDDEEGNIVHVGIVMTDYNIIHADGKVRIDKLDHSGIYNIDNQKHTHKLRMIKKMI